MKTLVPRVIGQTEEAKQHKASRTLGSRPARQWDENSFFAELSPKIPEATRAMHTVLDWAKGEDLRIVWTKNTKNAVFRVSLDHEGVKYKIVSGWSEGSLIPHFSDLKSTEMFSEKENRLLFLKKLNEVPGITLTEKQADGLPVIPARDLNSEASVTALLDALTSFVDDIRDHTPLEADLDLTTTGSGYREAEDSERTH